VPEIILQMLTFSIVLYWWERKNYQATSQAQTGYQGKWASDNGTAASKQASVSSMVISSRFWPSSDPDQCYAGYRSRHQAAANSKLGVGLRWHRPPGQV